MIVVKIELWPGGDEARRRVIRLISIWNTGGGLDEGDYRFAVSNEVARTSDDWSSDVAVNPIALSNGYNLWKSGGVVGHERFRGALRLLQRVLDAALRGEP